MTKLPISNNVIETRVNSNVMETRVNSNVMEARVNSNAILRCLNGVKFRRYLISRLEKNYILRVFNFAIW